MTCQGCGRDVPKLTFRPPELRGLCRDCLPDATPGGVVAFVRGAARERPTKRVLSNYYDGSERSGVRMIR